MAKHASELERQFHEAMLGVYEAARRLKPPYVDTRFQRMVLARGGKAAADHLLGAADPSEGFMEFFLRGKRLDLSVECLVLKKPWRGLFTEEQLTVARKRLEEHKFELPADDSEGGARSG